MTDTDRPKDDGAMFFVGMSFLPDASLSQKDLNKIILHLFRQIFTTPEGEPMPVSENDNTMLNLVQFLVDLDIRLDEKAFAKLPEDIRKYFLITHRDGMKYRYGQKPRWV